MNNLDFLIKEAEERLFINEDDEVIFIFSKATKFHTNNSTVEKRDNSIDLLTDNEYYIGTLSELKDFPSREFVYDTYTKELNKFKRYDKICKIITSMGFEALPSFIQTNEQIFILNINKHNIKLTLKNNLFYTLSISDNNFGGFFTKESLIASLRKSNDIIDDAKIDEAFFRNITLNDILS